ncbi:MAG TPA: thioredoxin [Candidatus Marinimicrobia bacterium]|nr:thioredoxin [Candidatus Neomarinimicrobiota bacterium]
MGSNTVEFTDSNFEQDALESDLPVLVDFWAEWCGPCLAIAPMVEEIAADYAGKVKVGKLNVDNNPQTAMKYGVRSIPTLLFIHNGAVTDQVVGSVQKGNITDVLDRILN